VHKSSCGRLEAVSSYLPIETAKNWDKRGTFLLWGRIWTLDLLNNKHTVTFGHIHCICTKYFSLKLRSWSIIFLVVLNICFPEHIQRVCKLCNSARSSPHDYRHFSFWVKRDQLDATCFSITLFSAQHVSDVNTSILRSLQLIPWVTSWVVSRSMCVGVTLQCGYGGVVSVCRLKH